MEIVEPGRWSRRAKGTELIVGKSMMLCGEKRRSEVPVPQTDTGRQEEDSKANGRKVVKELGKLVP